ncbi:MAG: hypothetical protein IPL21_07260 [Saprospirales bacterium]|nr:hypothetical protein [Saprospirales bacterium]
MVNNTLFKYHLYCVPVTLQNTVSFLLVIVGVVGIALTTTVCETVLVQPLEVFVPVTL